MDTPWWRTLCNAMAFYIYIYRNPLTGNVPIYVGKGKGERTSQ
jgi:hypothetical protein